MTDELYTVYTNIYQLVIDFDSLSKQIKHKKRQKQMDNTKMNIVNDQPKS